MRLPLLAALLLALPLPALAQDATIVATARSALSDLQTPSFREGREFCGVIGRLRDGSLAITRGSGGRVDSCTPRGYGAMSEVVATFHTHGSYAPEFDNEVPSLTDLLVVMAERVDGFVSTPGGRFWYVDGIRGEIRLICGPGCLPQDPRYVDDEEIPEYLDLNGLRARTRFMMR